MFLTYLIAAFLSGAAFAAVTLIWLGKSTVRSLGDEPPYVRNRHG